jgi:hypothetical protein
MRSIVNLKKLIACGLGILIVSCGASRHANPASTEELAEFVLILSELPNGEVTHSWQRAEDFDISPYRSQASSHSRHGPISPVAARPRDCDQENRDCYRECMSRPLPRGYGHVTSGRKRGGKSQYCRDICWQAYIDCSEPQGRQPREFTAVDEAVDWLKRNQKAILVGSVIMIAGVVFVVVSAGAGAAVLAPIVLVASSEVTSTARCAP